MKDRDYEEDRDYTRAIELLDSETKFVEFIDEVSEDTSLTFGTDYFLQDGEPLLICEISDSTGLATEVRLTLPTARNLIQFLTDYCDRIEAVFSELK